MTVWKGTIVGTPGEAKMALGVTHHRRMMAQMYGTIAQPRNVVCTLLLIAVVAPSLLHLTA